MCVLCNVCIVACTPIFFSLVLAISPEDLGSIPGWIIPKTQKMVLDATIAYHSALFGKDQG